MYIIEPKSDDNTLNDKLEKLGFYLGYKYFMFHYERYINNEIIRVYLCKDHIDYIDKELWIKNSGYNWDGYYIKLYKFKNKNILIKNLKRVIKESIF